MTPNSSKADPAPRQLVFLLHAHLPDCRRPDLRVSLEEIWFLEALIECYLPLVRMCDRLIADDIAPRLTLSLSPTLLTMLRDGALRARCRQRWQATEELARRDADQATGLRRRNAAWHARFLQEMRTLFDERCDGDLLTVLQEYHKAGHLELGTTAATHAFLPAHQNQRSTVDAQIAVGIDTFESAFGFRPTFFWLPECGYFPGLDEVMQQHGVHAFGLESHAITQAKPAPAHGVRAPVICPAGPRGLGRDAELSRLVWSAPEGYPGDPHYREFHRDGIYDLPPRLADAWLAPNGTRLPAGLKYWRVTGRDGDKEWYEPETAALRVREHAADFVERIVHNAETGLWFAPFDAELLGHWWFEGPLWLEHVFRLLAASSEIEAQTATAAAMESTEAASGQPAPSSWGMDGDHSYWINRETDWIYPLLFNASRRLGKLLGKSASKPNDEMQHRALRQAARTLLLAQASDWPFLIKSHTAADLARDRLTGLLTRFDTLCRAIETDQIDAEKLRGFETIDTAFPDLDLARFHPTE